MKALFDRLAEKKPVSFFLSLVAILMLFLGGVMYDVEVGVLHMTVDGGGVILVYLGMALGLIAVFGLVLEEHGQKK